MRVTHKKSSKKANVLVQHIKDNLKSYLLVAMILLIGIVLGVLFVNNLQEQQSQEVQSYVDEFVISLQNGTSIDTGKLLRNSIKNNLILVLVMWFAGSTVIGIPIVLGVIWYRGFCLGYTISALIAILGVGKGSLFFATAILLQNLIIIPCMLALAVSGIRLYKSIVKDKRKENIKGKIMKHTMFSVMMLIFLMIASFLETYLSSNLFMLCIQFF
ncbi:MAG: stage II sporulation protein M [Clostridia bacterium]|jgi:stage II sporulation protein M|nr:stage II sporulation protein M [Clostridia bacterium]